MNVSKFVRASLAMTACVSLLAACGDRAGQFRAKKWTAAEIEANFAAKNAKKKDANSLTDIPFAGNPDAGKTLPGPDAEEKGPLKDNSKDNPAKADPEKEKAEKEKAEKEANGPGAKTSVITELIPGQKFIKENDEMMLQIDPIALKTFPGVSASGNGSISGKAAVEVSMEAGIVLNKKNRFLKVLPQAVAFDEKDNKTTSLKYSVEDAEVEGKPVDEKNIVILAACKDSNCQAVYVRVSVPTENRGQATLVFVLSPEVKPAYIVTNSNLKDKWVEFQTWLEGSKKPSKEDTAAAEKAAKEKAEQAAKEKSEKAAAEKAEGEKAEKEKAEKAAAEKLAKDKADKEAADKTEKEKAEKEKGPGVIKEGDGKVAKAIASAEMDAMAGFFGGDDGQIKPSETKAATVKPSGEMDAMAAFFGGDDGQIKPSETKAADAQKANDEKAAHTAWFGGEGVGPAVTTGQAAPTKTTAVDAEQDWADSAAKTQTVEAEKLKQQPTSTVGQAPAASNSKQQDEEAKRKALLEDVNALSAAGFTP